jgi:hypothetical protein
MAGQYPCFFGDTLEQLGDSLLRKLLSLFLFLDLKT